MIPSILIDSRITGIIQHIEPTVQQQQQHDTYVTIALQEQKEQQQQQQRKQHDKDIKRKYRKQQQEHKDRKEQKRIKRRLRRDNKKQYQVEKTRHNKQQEYFEGFIMKQSRANDVIGSINKLYIDMKNGSVSMLASIPTKTKKMKKKQEKTKYEMKKLVLELIDAHQDKLRQNHEQQYKDNPDLFPDNPT